MTKNLNIDVDEHGYYGRFGGAYIPEMLHPNIEELRQKYRAMTADPEFKKEFDALLKDYVGPSKSAIFRQAPECPLWH